MSNRQIALVTSETLSATSIAPIPNKAPIANSKGFVERLTFSDNKYAVTDLINNAV